MRIVLVGADFEENLGVGMLAASLEAAGHAVEFVAFPELTALDSVVDRIVMKAPALVGLSMQFQHRAHEFLSLARRLREKGYRGHVTCGGQFPSLAYQEVLTHHRAVDSIVLHEGEETIVELAHAVQQGARLHDIRGLALRGDRGVPFRTQGRALPADLDALPFPKRYRPHSRHVGVPFIPISGSRGCWGACSYCSITSFYRDARGHGGGRLLRLRSPQSIATEMALLWLAAGGPSVFCFHDDNFLLPRPQASLERVTAIRNALDDFGVGKAGIIGKCRPETLTPELAGSLRDLGVVRLYIGVENASQGGSDHLNRRTQAAHVHAALAAARQADIFACYNLLIFEPNATLEDVRENIAFMREHAVHPVNFCRAEPYHGTPLHRSLVGKPGLGGSYLGWDYRIADDRTELLFRICAAAFRERNFAPNGVANRTMGLGYSVKLLESFYDERDGQIARVRRRADAMTREITFETAGLLERALELAADVDLADHDRVARQTALLGLEIAALDRVWHVALDDLHRDMDAFVTSVDRARRPRKPSRKLVEAMQGLAVASLLAVGVGCGGESTTNDPVPHDAGIDANEAGGDSASDVMVSDPLPEDGGAEADVMVADPPPPDASFDDQWADPPPADAGFDDQWADPPPADAGFVDQWADPVPEDASFDVKQSSLIDRWRDTAPRRAKRSRDLALSEPPGIRLASSREGEHIVVRVVGGPEAITLRWETFGCVEGDGREVVWIPESDDDQLRVAIRTQGGVAVASVRATEV